MERFGPQYCETPATITGIFPVEPANAISSGVIVLFGIVALILVIQRSPRAIELYVACALLMLNGLGSILWHGLRTRWALTFDVLPAVVFVLLVALIWARRVGPWWQVAAIGGALVLAPVAVQFLELGSRFPLRFGVVAFVIVALALLLIARSYAVSRAAALTGTAAVLSALTALTFRSIDSMACESIGLGTHFLWHMFLSGGAFLCLYTILTLDAARRQATPAPAIA
ncbi:MAG: ceramidase domain-containing protein [Alphaproteobacteria bacterium]|jgi:hypothetical protein|nr:ceramidase domain-containing protein [Alphaproteobacteria bacterium]